MTWAMWIVVVLGWVGLASSQCVTSESTSQVWDYDKDLLYWALPANDATPPTGVRLRAWRQGQTTVIMRDFPLSQTSVPAKQMLPGPGKYIMTFSEIHGATEEDAGPECPFELSATPVAQPKISGGVRKP